MKKIPFIIITIISLLIASVFMFWDRGSTSSELKFTDEGSDVTPTNSFTTLPIPTSDGAIEVTDVTTLPEIQNVGDDFYRLTGTRSDSAAGFSFVYAEFDNSYAIALEKEPLAATRIAASQYLLELLQITQEEACRLNVLVGVPFEVNAELAGVDLGLSFCPDAVPLE